MTHRLPRLFASLIATAALFLFMAIYVWGA